MAVELAVGYVSIVPSAKGFKQNLEKEVGPGVAAAGRAQGEKMGDGMASGIKSRTKAMVSPVAAAFAAAGALKFGADSVEAYKEAEQSSARLADVFSRFPTLADSNVAAFEKLAEARAKVTRFDDDATKSGQAVLAQFKLTGKQVEDLTPLMQDYAAKTGKDLPDAADSLGKAMLGKGRALAEIGINFKDTKTLAGNFEQVMVGLRTQVGGFAEKEGQTAAGQSEIMANQFGELKELVGSKLVPVLLRLTTVGIGVFGWLASMSPTTQRLVVTVVALATGVFVVVKAIQAFTAVQAALNVVLALNPIGLVVIAVAALVVGLVVAYNKVDWFKKGVDGAFNGILATVRAVVAAIKTEWEAVDFDASKSSLFGFGVKAPEWVPGVGGKKFGFNTPESFDGGGMIPGPVGAPRLILAHGGEEVLTPAQQAGGGSGAGGPMIGSVQVDARGMQDPLEVAEFTGRHVAWRLATAGVR